MILNVRCYADDNGNLCAGPEEPELQEYRPLTEYERGRYDMLHEIISRLADYEALKCAQIAASIPVRREDAE